MNGEGSGREARSRSEERGNGGLDRDGGVLMGGERETLQRQLVLIQDCHFHCTYLGPRNHGREGHKTT